MHGPDQGEPRRRRLHGEKIILALDRNSGAFTHAQGGLQLEAEGIGVNPFGRDESLLAVGKTSDDGAGAPLGSRRIHRLEDVKAHQASFST